MRLIASILLLLLLSGCAGNPPTEVPDPVVQVKFVRAECGSPPKRSAVNLRPIEWLIIDGRFTLSAEGYEDLGYNVSTILGGIRELQSEIDFYEQCLEDEDGSESNSGEAS